MRYVLGSRASIGGVLGSGRGGAAAAWYLAGGVSAANCIAAYTPKGAASLAASYDNNAAPGNGLADGTYDAAPGTAPTFDTATGWTFAAASNQYLTTGIVPGKAYSVLMRFTDSAASASTAFSFGIVEGTGPTFGRFYLQPNYTGAGVRYGNGTGLTQAPLLTSGVIGMAGYTAYRNGSADGSLSDDGLAFTRQCYIGAVNNAGTTYYVSIKIQALAIYNVTLTAPQVAAISSAMSAL